MNTLVVYAIISENAKNDIKKTDIVIYLFNSYKNYPLRIADNLEY